MPQEKTKTDKNTEVFLSHLYMMIMTLWSSFDSGKNKKKINKPPHIPPRRWFFLIFCWANGFF